MCAILRDCRHVHVLSEDNFWESLLSFHLLEGKSFISALLYTLGWLAWELLFDFSPFHHLSVGVHGVSCVLLLHLEAFIFFYMSLREWTENSCLQSRYCYLLSFLSLRTTGDQHGTLWIAKSQELWRLNLITRNWLICPLCFSHILEVCLPEALPFTHSPSGSALRLSL